MSEQKKKPSIERQWISYSKSQRPDATAATTTNKKYRMMTYNVLAQSLIKRIIYPYASTQALRWKQRQELLKNEFQSLRPDLICLQEVNVDALNYWKSLCTSLNLDIEYTSKTERPTSHGILIGWNTEIWEKIDCVKLNYQSLAEQYKDIPHVYTEMNHNNVGLIVVLKFKQPIKPDSLRHQGIILASTHLQWNPMFSFVRLKQAAMLIQEIQKLQQQYGYEVLIGGDFNVTPDHMVYECLTQHTIQDKDLPMFLSPPEAATKLPEEQISLDDLLLTKPTIDLNDPEHHHRVTEVKQILSQIQQLPKLVSLYHNYYDHCLAQVPSDNIKLDYEHKLCQWQHEPPFTVFVERFRGTLDYIFVNEDHCFHFLQYLSIPCAQQLSHQTALPNDLSPSDHLSLVVDFQII